MLALFFAVFLLWISAIASAAGGPLAIRVGVPQDPPLSWINEQNEVRGFFPDLIERIAQQEGWQIEYVPGSWCQMVQWLVDGEIDLLPGLYPEASPPDSIALSHSPILVDWGQVYSSKNAGIQTILDLEGKKVAVEGSCVFFEGETGIRNLADKFNVHIDFVPFDDPAVPLQNLRVGTIDAVVLGRFYNNQKELRGDIVMTPILVSPVTLYFGAPRGHYHLFLQTIDKHISAMKLDRSSVYYQSWEKWFSHSLDPILPVWIVHFAATLGGLTLLLFGFVLFARHQVEKKTREVSAKNRQLRSLSTELTLAEERERRRLAELLHDDLGQNLALAKIRLATLDVPENSVECRSVMGELKGFLTDAIRSTRSLTTEVSPPALYNLSFQASLKWLTEHILSGSRIEAQVVSNGLDLSLEEDVKVLLFKTVRELLVNIVKHAQASFVKVEMKSDHNFLYLDIIDNGIGLPGANPLVDGRGKPGFGLLSIRERLAYLGGEFALEPHEGQGTCARLKIPIEKSTEERFS